MAKAEKIARGLAQVTGSENVGAGDAGLAIRAVNPAKRPRPLSIFLSHKARDKVAATRLRELLLYHGRGLIEVFVSEHDLKRGVQWQPQLWDHLAGSQLLILLFTDPADNWNWCLFESGFFVGRHKAHEVSDTLHRLICLHPAELTPPKPLEHWQSVPADPETVGQFLREVFQPINPELLADSERFEDLVQQTVRIVGESAPKPDEFFFTFELAVILTRSQMQELKETLVMPEEVRIEASARTWEEVFGLANPGSGGQVWKEFVRLLALEAHRMWTDYLPIAIAKINDFHAFPPVLPLLCRRDPDGGISSTTYRPMILQRTRLPEHWTRFRIILGRTPDSATSQSASAIARLFHLIRLTRHLSCEALPKCRKQLDFAQAPGRESHARPALEAVRAELLFVRTEAMNRGIQVGTDIFDLFEESEHNDLEELMQHWRTADESFRRASDGPDLTQASAALKQMQVLSAQALQRYARRFAEVARCPTS